MPPKRKTTTDTTTTTTTTAPPSPPPKSRSPSPPPKAKSKAKDDDDDIMIDSKTKKAIRWYWAADSKNGSQDTWQEYSTKISAKLEKAFKDNKKKVEIDDERFVDLTTMSQKRYDDATKQRGVSRTLEDSKTKAKGPAQKPQSRETKGSDDDDGTSKKKQKTTRKKKAVSDDDDGSGSDVSVDSDDDDDDDDYVRWQWAGDSGGGPAKGGGHQDVWIEYDKKMCLKLEKGFSKNKKRIRVDKERFVDMQNMLQRRYDDESKRRSIKRLDPPKKKKTTSSSSITTTAPNKKVKKVQSDEEEESDDDSKKKKGKSKKDDSKDDSKKSDTTATVVVTPPPKPPAINPVIRAPSTWTDQSNMDYKEFELDKVDDEFSWMQTIFTNSIWAQHKTQPGLSPIRFSGLQVTRVFRIQNPVLWMRYIHRKDTIVNGANGGKCTPTLTKVLTVTGKGPTVDANANEFFLFHGLNTSSAIGITKFGFDPRFCSLNGMFGAGLYFAENSSKSNQYCHGGNCTSSGFQATSCKCAQNDDLCMLVCRVTLGDPLIENVFRGNNPGDFWHNKRTEPKKPDNQNIYNSVVGESKINFGYQSSLQLREYIVYESSQVYPEYKVYFKRNK